MPRLIPLPPDPITIEQAELILGHYTNDAGQLAAGVAMAGRSPAPFAILLTPHARRSRIMEKQELVWGLAVVNLLAWLAVIGVLFVADAIGTDAATLQAQDIWVVLIAALVGIVTSMLLSLRLWTNNRPA